jgi:crotonobetainyl-CoA:carnitine CoA-transferase CaiB-like acyl-CoA transferase
MMLGDMGADVIKIEHPRGGDEARGWGPPFEAGESSYFLSVNRNKRSLTLDLKSEKGKEALRRLVKTADVLLENFSPGVLEKLGFGWNTLHELNTRLVYCAISGFGQFGPRKYQPAYDQILQGMGGLMSVTGEPDGPPTRFGVSIADIGAGMFSAFAVVNALFYRERTGQGQMIDTSLLDGQVALLTFQAGRFFATGEAPKRVGNRHPLIAPYEVFRSGDGYVNLAVGNDKQWIAFCKAMGLDDLAEDASLANNQGRVAHRERLKNRIEERFASLTTAGIVEVLEAANVPCGPIYTIDQVFADAQAQALGLRHRMEHPAVGEISVTTPPYRFSASPATVRLAPPTLGQHNSEILREIGLED